MFESLFGAEGSLIVRFIVAFVIVLGLIGLTFWLVRRFGGTRVSTAAARGRQPRLAVVDAAPVDGRRRLVLIRRDNVEHLVMIGGPSDIVVEQNIMRAVPVNAPRDVPVPRTPGAVEAASARPPAEDSWTPPELPVQRPAPEPRPTFARPDTTLRPRPTLPSLSSPRSTEPPLVPSAEPSELEPRGSSNPDAALASMAQRLEAALRRPTDPRMPEPPKSDPAERRESAFEFPSTETPAAATTTTTPPAASTTPARPDPKASKSVLDSLEQEMASLLGRPPGKE